MHTAVVGTSMKAFQVPQAPCQLGRWIWSRPRYSWANRATFLVFPTISAHARLLEWVWPLKFHFSNFIVLVFSGERNSLLCAPVTSNANMPARLNLTATRQTLIATTATTATPIRATASDLLGLVWSVFRGRIHSIRWEGGGAPGLQYGSRLNIYYKQQVLVEGKGNGNEERIY